jgi:NAD-dependent deacetylase
MNTPQTISSVSEFLSLIDAKKTLFYTGAWLSYGAVPTMQDLKDLIQLDREKDIDWLLMSVMTDPWALERRWTKFATDMINAQPSAWHRALTQLCINHGVHLFTENLDLLHQRAGIMPIIPEWPDFEKELSLEDIARIDYIVTVGLSHDDRWLLAYIRKHNPKMRIVSLNPQKVDYLWVHDFWFAEDCQKVLPLIV